VFGGVELFISEVAALTTAIAAGLAGAVPPLELTWDPAPTATVLPDGVRKDADPVAKPKPRVPANPEVPRIPAVPTGVMISKLEPLFCFATSNTISP
jgi:hypothetical protein